MGTRNQDIHRIQEIRLLLENRQRLFSGLNSKSLYGEQGQGDLLGVSGKGKEEKASEISLGQSIKATFGSTSLSEDRSEGNGEGLEDWKVEDYDLEFLSQMSRDDDVPPNTIADSYHADADKSHSESSLNSTDDEQAKVKKVKLRRRRGKVTSMSLDFEKLPRKKSVTFEKIEVPQQRPMSVKKQKVVPVVPVAKVLRPKLKSKQADKLDPIDKLRKQSNQLKAEVAKRLDRTAAAATLVHLSRKAVEGVTVKSLVLAREKLKDAEKSLKATIKKTENTAFKRVESFRRLSQSKESVVPPPAPKSSKMKPWMAFRPDSDVLRSELSLREAFALIKINPEPILDYKLTDELEDKLKARTRPKEIKQEVKSFRSGASHGYEYIDADTEKSLKRLRKLSVLHQKRQKYLIPESVTAEVVLGQKAKAKEEKSSKKDRRKSSVGTVDQFLKERKREKEGKNMPRIVFSGLEIALRAEGFSASSSSAGSGSPTSSDTSFN